MFWWHLQPFLLPDPLNTLVVHMPARLVEHACHHAITVATVFSSQLDDVFNQTFFIGTTTGNFALSGAMLTKHAARPALRDAQSATHLINAPTSAGRA